MMLISSHLGWPEAKQKQAQLYTNTSEKLAQRPTDNKLTDPHPFQRNSVLNCIPVNS